MVAATPDNANPIIHSTGGASRRATKRADELDFGDDESWERMGRDPLNGEIVMDSLAEREEDSAGEEIDKEEIFGKPSPRRNAARAQLRDSVGYFSGQPD